MIAANQIVDLGLKDVGYEDVNSEFAALKCEHWRSCDADGGVL